MTASKTQIKIPSFILNLGSVKSWKAMQYSMRMLLENIGNFVSINDYTNNTNDLFYFFFLAVNA